MYLQIYFINFPGLWRCPKLVDNYQYVIKKTSSAESQDENLRFVLADRSRYCSTYSFPRSLDRQSTELKPQLLWNNLRLMLHWCFGVIPACSRNYAEEKQETSAELSFVTWDHFSKYTYMVELYVQSNKCNIVGLYVQQLLIFKVLKVWIKIWLFASHWQHGGYSLATQTKQQYLFKIFITHSPKFPMWDFSNCCILFYLFVEDFQKQKHADKFSLRNKNTHYFHFHSFYKHIRTPLWKNKMKNPRTVHNVCCHSRIYYSMPLVSEEQKIKHAGSSGGNWISHPAVSEREWDALGVCSCKATATEMWKASLDDLASYPSFFTKLIVCCFHRQRMCHPAFSSSLLKQTPDLQ